MKKSNISWCDYPFDPWVGCKKKSPGCKNCFAIHIDKRQGGNHWVDPPRIMAESNWKKLYTLERKAVLNNEAYKVFVGPMCDVFYEGAPDGQRDRLWQVIKETSHLTYQLLTKRADNIEKYLPNDWGDEGYENVWLGVSVENIKHGLPRIELLKKIPAQIRFLSIEPLLEDLGPLDLSGIHWIIVGGESAAKSKARNMKVKWVLDIQRQCKEQDVAFFFKQWNGKDGCLLNGKVVQEYPEF